MAENAFVKPVLGSHWSNHGGGFVKGKLLTVEPTTYTWIQQIIGLLWACAGISIGAVIVRSIDLHRAKSLSGFKERPEISTIDSERGSASGRRSNESANRAHPDTTPLLHASDSAADNGTIAQTEPVQDGNSSISRSSTSPALKPRFVRWSKKGLCFALALGFSASASVYTSSTVPNIGLLSSKHCGTYGLQDVDNTIDRIKDNVIQAEKERRAGRYARDCYTKRDTIVKDSDGEPHSVDPDRCTFFNTKSISYDIHYDQPCPFKDPNICAESHNAVEFVTSDVSASDLGINSHSLPFFRRKAVCAPLTMDSRYVDPPGHYPVKYAFGPLRRSNVTFIQPADPFDYYISAYRVNALEHPPWDEESSWIPIDELTPNVDGMNPKNAYTTAIFVEACRILYAGASDDYIFPAQHLYNDGPMYYNQDRRARPLACVDWLEVCQSDGKCRQTWEESNPNEVEYEFVRAAMWESTIFSALEFRLGAALLAQDKIDDFRSQKLDGRQWILEAAALFETSLSRIQHDALDIAIGFGHEKVKSGLYYDQAPEWMIENSIDMCHLYKFKLPPGYLNISYNAAITTVVILVVFALLGIPTFWRRYDSEEMMEKVGEHALVFEVFISLFHLFSKCVRRSRGKAPQRVTQTEAHASSPDHENEGRSHETASTERRHIGNGHPKPPRGQLQPSAHSEGSNAEISVQDEQKPTQIKPQSQNSSTDSESNAVLDHTEGSGQLHPDVSAINTSSETDEFEPVSLNSHSENVT